MILDYFMNDTDSTYPQNFIKEFFNYTEKLKELHNEHYLR